MTTSKPKLRTGTRMSVDEFLDIPDTDEYRWLELDDGALYVMPTPRRGHQFLKVSLATFFCRFLDGFSVPPAEVYSGLTTILSGDKGRVLLPDLIVVLAEHADIFVRGYAKGPPDIVIEILSTDRDRDLVRKRQVYAEAGVPEYWIFDPLNDAVLPLELAGGEYVERDALGAGDILTTPLLPGLAIPLSDLFGHRQRPRDEA